MIASGLCCRNTYAVPARRLSSSDHRNKPEPSKRLLDNQSYVFDGSIVKNGRLPSGTVVFDEAPGRRTRPEHFENEIWHFLNSVSRDVEKTLNDSIADALILFNDVRLRTQYRRWIYWCNWY